MGILNKLKATSVEKELDAAVINRVPDKERKEYTAVSSITIPAGYVLEDQCYYEPVLTFDTSGLALYEVTKWGSNDSRVYHACLMIKGTLKYTAQLSGFVPKKQIAVGNIQQETVFSKTGQIPIHMILGYGDVSCYSKEDYIMKVQYKKQYVSGVNGSILTTRNFRSSSRTILNDAETEKTINIPFVITFQPQNISECES